MSSTVFTHIIHRISTGGDKLVSSNMFRAVGVLFLAALFPSMSFAQNPVSRVLFRVFLTDGRVLSSYGQ